MGRENKLLRPVAAAAALVGGVTKLAELLGIERPALYNWKRVPAERVSRIEEVTAGKISRHTLRPDLFPASREKPFRAPLKRRQKVPANAR
jgi:DNA-binding transcriptional regulator YdaS (Cro superfamily)